MLVLLIALAAPAGLLTADSSSARFTVDAAVPAVISAWPASDYFGVSGFTPSENVDFTIRDAGGEELASGNKPADTSGLAGFSRPQDFSVDLAAGMEVSVSQGTITKTLILAPITIASFSPATDTVAGTAAPGAQLDVYLWTPAGNSPTIQVTADADGTWSVTFAPYDITYAATAYAAIRDVDGDATRVSRQAPVLKADFGSDAVNVYGFAPGGSVELTIRESPGGTVLASTSKQADGSGYAWFGPQDFSVDLAAGMELTASQGALTKTLTLAPLTISAISPDTDSVAGTAPPGAQLEVYVYNLASPSSPTKPVTAAADGTWSLDFAPFDITYTTTASASLRDTEGDTTSLSRTSPRVDAWLNSISVSVYGFTSAGSVELTIRESPGGTVLASTSKQADGSGYAWFGPQDFSVDLAAGMELTASQGALTKTLTLAPLTISAISPDTDSVAGTAPPGAQLEVYVYNQVSPRSPTKQVIAAETGTWSLDFAPFDITHTATAYAGVRDVDGDTTSLARTSPRVDALLHGSVSVYGFTSAGSVELTIRESPGGTVLASTSKQADRSGYAWFGPQDFSADLAAGMELTASQGALTKTLTLAPLTISAISPDTDSVAGTAPPGAQLEVYVYNQNSISPTQLVTAAADGTWSLDFAPFDITYTATAYAGVRDADGDATRVDRQAPVLRAELSYDSVSVHGFAPGGSVELTVRESPGGKVLAEDEQEADSNGYAWFSAGVDLSAGLAVTVTDGTSTKELTLAALAIAYVNQVRDVVAGTASAGARLEVFVYDQEGYGATKQVTADSEGEWSADFAGAYDIADTGAAYVTHYDDDGDATSQARSAESDTTTPVATFDAGPSGLTNDATPSFSFSADEPASFECRVDGAAFADCSSPHTTAALGDGSHTFDVRAIDTAGNIGTVATRAFAVDTTPPVASIDAGPSGITTVATPTFVFSAGEPASFECRLDGNAFAACTSPYTTAPLADGAHSFEVRATDTAGNIGSAVATTFTVATPTPGGGGGGGGGGAGNPDLAVSIVANRTAVEVGGSVDLTVTVRNNGPQSGTGVVLAITLPESATLLGPPAYDRGSGCTGASPLSCNLDFLPAGVQSTVRFSTGLRQAGPQTITAKVTSVETDLAAADNVSAVTITVAAALTATPPPKPVLFRPVLGAPTYVPKKPVAGQALRVALVVRRSDNGSLLRSGKVNCDPFITGRLIRHTESFRNGVVRISLKVPQAAKGKLLRMKVTFRIGDRSTTRIASIRIK